MTGAVGRRTVVAGAAWAVPALAVAASAPAQAASICYPFGLSGTITNTNADRITLRNTGTVAIPSGTVITWVVQNLTNAWRTYTVTSYNGVTLTSGNASVNVASGASVTFTFTLDAALAAGGTVAWEIYAGNNARWYRYNSSVVLGTSGCSAVCISDTGGNAFGVLCPQAPFAAARSIQAAPDAGPGPRRG